MAVISLPSHHKCKVSDEDYDRLQGYNWWGQRDRQTDRIYVYTQLNEHCPVLDQKVRRKVYMHRLVTSCPKGWLVDHKNRNTLDNRRPNLRITTGSFNSANRGTVPGQCGYRGVTRSGIRAYRARIEHQGREHNLGTFADLVAAAMAYDAKAKELFGEFAWLNFDRTTASEDTDDTGYPPFDDASVIASLVTDGCPF